MSVPFKYNSIHWNKIVVKTVFQLLSTPRFHDLLSMYKSLKLWFGSCNQNLLNIVLRCCPDTFQIPFQTNFKKWLFRTLFLESRFQNYPDSVILRKYQSLSSQSFKHNSAHMSSINLTAKLSLEPRFHIFIINDYYQKSKPGKIVQVLAL